MKLSLFCVAHVKSLAGSAGTCIDCFKERWLKGLQLDACGCVQLYVGRWQMAACVLGADGWLLRLQHSQDDSHRWLPVCWGQMDGCQGFSILKAEPLGCRMDIYTCIYIYNIPRAPP